MKDTPHLTELQHGRVHGAALAGWAALACCGIFAAFLVNPAPGQTPEKPPEASFKATTNLVVIPVSVTDGANRFALGLQKEDFQLFEDGVEADASRATRAGSATLGGSGLRREWHVDVKLRRSR